MDISIATEDDLDGVMSLVASCTRHMASQGIDQWDDVYPGRSVLAQDIAGQSLFVVKAHARIIAAIVLNEHQEPEYRDIPWTYRDGRVLVVHRLCVHPDAQGQKVATRLMDFAEKQARSQGYSAIRLDAFTRNHAAVSLYEHRGYRRAGTVMFRKGPFYCYEWEVKKE